MTQSVQDLAGQLQHGSVGAFSPDRPVAGHNAAVCAPDMTAAEYCHPVMGVSSPDGTAAEDDLAVVGECSRDVISADKPSVAAGPVPTWHPLAETEMDRQVHDASIISLIITPFISSSLFSGEKIQPRMSNNPCRARYQ